MDFKYYLDLVVRRLPWILILAFVGTVIGVFVAMSLPPSYDARAVLIVEAEQIPDDLASSTVSTGELETLQIIQQRILSRGSLLELSNRLGVYARPGGTGPRSRFGRLQLSRPGRCARPWDVLSVG